MSDDPLQALIVDAAELDRKRIADALKEVAGIDPSGRVVPLPRFQNLTAHQKILAFLLARRVAVLLELADEEAIGPSALSRQTGIPDGTVYPAVRELHEDRLVSQDSNSGYYLSPFQVASAIEAVEEGGEAPSQKSPDKTGKRGSSATKKSSDEPASKPPKRSRSSSSGGFSPTQAVKDLIAEGFFREPRVLSDVQASLKDKKAYEVAVTTLSPIFTRLLREGQLEREKNADGTYEYTSPTHRDGT